MEKEAHIMRNLVELVMKAEKKFHILSALKEDRNHLNEMYEAFASSYETLAREMVDDVEAIAQVLRSAYSRSDELSAAYSLLNRLKVCFDAPCDYRLEAVISAVIKAAENRQLAEAQKIMNDQLKAKKEEFLRVRDIFSDCLQLQQNLESSKLPVLNVNSIPQPDMGQNLHRPSPPVKKFSPKYSPSEIESNPPKHARVIITTSMQPGEIYVQIDDEDLSRFYEMQKELQEEFRLASKASASYCSTPLVGNVYALQSIKSGEWFRVLVESYHQYKRNLAFFVDTGYRESFKSNMMFHILPERFMDLPAQAIRCHLHSVKNIRNQSAQTYCQLGDVFQFMSRYINRRAVAIFHCWTGTDVGYQYRPTKLDKNGATLELRAFAILFANGHSTSINSQVCQASMGYTARSYGLELPEHFGIRERLLTANTSKSFASSSSCIRRTEKDDAAPDSRWNEEKKLMTLSVTFVECQSPDSISFRTPRLQNKFNRMQNELSNFDFTLYEEEPINFDVGFVCAIECQNIWYRAEVVDMESYPEIVVSLLDTGLTLNVNANEIRRLPEALSRIPGAILRCSLFGLYPPPKTGYWDKSITDFIRNRLREAGKITIGWRKDVKFSRRKVLPVTICINNEILKEPCASGASLNEEAEELRRLGLAITTGHSLPLFKSSWKSSELPKIGNTFIARAKWFNAMGEIFLQDVRSKQELDYIRQYLHGKYEGTLSTESDFNCSPGDLCIAKFMNDWFRCTIRATRGKEIEIYFADFGIVDVVDINDIRLDIALEEKPVQVLRCAIWNQHKSSACCNTSIRCTTGEHNVMFHEEPVEGVLAVTVKASGPPLQVELIYQSKW